MAVSTVIVFFGMHFVVAVLMVAIGCLYHVDNLQYTGLTREDINSVPSLTLAVGILIIVFLIGSCIIRNMYNKEGYITMSLLLLIIQLAAGVHGCIKVNDKSGTLNNTLQQDMVDSIAQFYKSNNTRYIYYLNEVQIQLQCCGVRSSSDYNITQLPASCCPEQTTNDTYCINIDHRFREGCAPKVYDRITHNAGTVAYVTIVLSFIQLCGTLFITLKLIGMDRALVPEDINYHHF